MKKLSLPLLAITAFTFTLISTACTWVKVTPQASHVAVANPANVRGCENVREVTVSVTSKVGFIKRDKNKVATELTSLARNEAVNFGGDTIVPSSTITDGRQSFDVYKCNKK